MKYLQFLFIASFLCLQLSSCYSPIKVDPYHIDCGKLSEELEVVLDADQKMRQDMQQFDREVDRQNLSVVVSILDSCGMPSLDIVKEKHITAIWLVLQHSDRYWMEKYFPILKASAERGDLSWSKIATMEDRILMLNGKPQKYGSQVVNNKLYKLEAPESVDQRRAKVGMESLKDYLQYFDINFDTPQKVN